MILSRVAEPNDLPLESGLSMPVRVRATVERAAPRPGEMGDLHQSGKWERLQVTPHCWGTINCPPTAF